MRDGHRPLFDLSRRKTVTSLPAPFCVDPFIRHRRAPPQALDHVEACFSPSADNVREDVDGRKACRVLQDYSALYGMPTFNQCAAYELKMARVGHAREHDVHLAHRKDLSLDFPC